MQTVWTKIRHDKTLGLIWPKLFDTLLVFLKEFFEKVDFEKNQQTTKKHAKLPRRQRVKSFPYVYLCINTSKLPRPSDIVQELAMVISVVIRTVGFCMVTRGQGCHLVSIYRVGPEEVLDLLCHL